MQIWREIPKFRDQKLSKKFLLEGRCKVGVEGNRVLNIENKDHSLSFVAYPAF